jgi:hypothetical protein
MLGVETKKPDDSERESSGNLGAQWQPLSRGNPAEARQAW